MYQLADNYAANNEWLLCAGKVKPKSMARKSLLTLCAQSVWSERAPTKLEHFHTANVYRRNKFVYRHYFTMMPFNLIALVQAFHAQCKFNLCRLRATKHLVIYLIEMLFWLSTVSTTRRINVAPCFAIYNFL